MIYEDSAKGVFAVSRAEDVRVEGERPVDKCITCDSFATRQKRAILRLTHRNCRYELLATLTDGIETFLPVCQIFLLWTAKWAVEAVRKGKEILHFVQDDNHFVQDDNGAKGPVRDTVGVVLSRL